MVQWVGRGVLWWMCALQTKAFELSMAFCVCNFLIGWKNRICVIVVLFALLTCLPFWNHFWVFEVLVRNDKLEFALILRYFCCAISEQAFLDSSINGWEFQEYCFFCSSYSVCVCVCVFVDSHWCLSCHLGFYFMFSSA